MLPFPAQASEDEERTLTSGMVVTVRVTVFFAYWGAPEYATSAAILPRHDRSARCLFPFVCDARSAETPFW